MINKETIERIVDAALIEEVVADFVDLKKRGINFIGLCPFHNEKTPSFNVNPAKNIFKCFGCGKGGDSLSFIMEHEKFSYPEALKYLANKYHIEIVENINEYRDPEQDNFRESLFVVSDYAQKYFAENLIQSEEGKNIAHSYFIERGFREDTIKKFGLGFNLSSWDAFSKTAIDAGYKEEYLVGSGLSIKKENGELIDRFRSRVMFPIHSISGRVIGFGGRILKKDDKIAKYLNSPESEIYHKSRILYGLFFAKKAIREVDECYLVEGYTDVVSLHQSGIENVVSSSGTSLTVEQIRLIARFSKNVTILYDGDPAGLKASLRGIDLILEEGLNVKVVLFPQGEDPDSYVQKLGGKAFKEFIDINKKDFILFKTSLLLEEVKNDPIKKAGLIHEIVESIAKIPDQIKASIFIKECSVLMDMEERVLLVEYNKLVRKRASKTTGSRFDESLGLDVEIDSAPREISEKEIEKISEVSQEKEIIRLLLNYGNLEWSEDMNIAQYVLQELENANFIDETYLKIFTIYQAEIGTGQYPAEESFYRHTDPKVKEVVSDLLISKYNLSPNWYTKHDIIVPDLDKNYKSSVINALNHFKLKIIVKMIVENQTMMKEAATDGEMEYRQKTHIKLTEIKNLISKEIGSIIIK